MANAGGCWDNAKKVVEVDLKEKGTPLHAATVIGDTVGDPLKDTAGPALNPMIKVVNLVSLIAAPILVKYSSLGVMNWIVIIVLAGAVYWGISQSKRPAAKLTAAQDEASGD